MKTSFSKNLLVLICITFIFAFSPQSAKTINAAWSSPMGITPTTGFDSWAATENSVKLTKEAGVAWNRLFVPSSYIITPTGNINTDSLEKLDRLLGLYKQYNLHAYIMLFNNSDFIGSTQNCENDDPLGWPTHLWHSPPGNKAKWAEYVATLVDRYKSSVKYWEISSEEIGRAHV